MASHVSTMDQLTDYLGIAFPGLDFSNMGRVPTYLKTGVNCFKPSMVSIGPYFRHSLLDIDDKVKLQMACDLIPADRFNTFKSNMEKVLEEGMRYYPEGVVDKFLIDSNIEVTRDNRINFFRIILFLDSCFIVRLIELVFSGEEYQLPLGSMIAKRCIRDLTLADNQIPWVVLKQIFQARYGLDCYAYGQLNSFVNWVISSSTERFSSENLVNSTEPFASDLIDLFKQNPVHFLDIVRLKIIRFDRNRNSRRVNIVSGSLTSASRMRRSWGISFAVDEDRDVEVRSITFKNGHLYLPKVLICEFSETLFMNLIAYENSLGLKGNGEISTYMWLMGLLLSDEESVRLLRDKVVLSYYNDKEIVELFKRVTPGLMPNRELLEESVELIKIYQDSNVMLRRKWALKIEDVCFSTSWRTLATVGIFVGLISTIYT